MKDKALKLALEALEGVLDDAPKVLDASIAGGLYEVVQCRDAIAAIKEALAQPEQEPVAKVVSTAPDRIWLDLGFDPSDEDEVSFHELIDVTWSHDNASGYGVEYVRVDTTQPQRTWVGLTTEEILGLQDFAYADDFEFVNHIETLLKEKNNE